MESTEQFVKVGIVYNAFDATNVQKSELLYQEGQKLSHYLGGLPDTVDWKVGLNGVPVEADKFEETEVLAQDNITLVMIPRGGGGIKNILRIVAMVAVVVAAVALFGPAIGTSFGGGIIASSGMASMIGMATVMAAGSMLVNTLLPPTMPKLGTEEGKTYGYDGAKNTAREGVALPVVYGTFRVAGNYIDLYTENQGYDQYLYGRTVLSDGEITNVTDIEINDQPIANFDNITTGFTAGTNSEPINPYFGRSVATQSYGVELTSSNTEHTTVTDVDALQFNIMFPGGLTRYNDKGKKRIHSATVYWGYRIAGSGSAFTTGSRTYTGSETKTLRRTIELNFATRGTYEVYIRRNVEADDDQIVDDINLIDIAEIQASKVAVRSVATGWYRVKMDEQLNSIPNVTWKVQGVKVNQYDASGNVVTRAWSANPAWITLDKLIGPERGQFNNTIGIDYQAYYDWAQYCDANALYFNGVFDNTQSLWDCLSSVYRVGRAMPVRIGTKLSVAVDKIEEPVMMFGAGNIEKDTFNISYLPLTDRANEYEVSYYDKDDRNKKKTIRIIDPDAEARGDIPRPANYELFGVDNFEQAQKEVWYQLYQNRLARRTVSFRAPIESIALAIGDVALIQHDMVDWGISGRIKAGISTTQVQLDKDITLADGDTLLVIFDQIGAGTDVIEERTVTAVDELTNTVTVSAPFSAIPQAAHNYMFGQSANVYRPFRLRAISGEDIHSRELTFVEYHEAVYGPPEQVIPAPDARASQLIVPHVDDLAFITATDYNDTATKDVITTVGWTSGHIRKYAGADVYIGLISTEDYAEGITTPEFTLHGTVNTVNEVQLVVDYGYHLFVKVVAFDTDGKRAPSTSAPTITASISDPITLATPVVATDGSAIDHIVESNGIGKLSFEFTWPDIIAAVDGFYVEVEYSPNSDMSLSTKEKFTLQPTQRAVVIGNVDPTNYHKLSVQAFKRAHDIFNTNGLILSTKVYATGTGENPYRPSVETPHASGDIFQTITDQAPFVDILDKVSFNPTPPSSSEDPIAVTLTASNVLVPCDDEGLNPVLTGTGTQVHVKQGPTALLYDGSGTASGTWKILSITATECTAGAVSDGGDYAIIADLTGITTGTTVISASLEYQIVGKTLAGTAFAETIVQNFKKIVGMSVDTTPPAIPTALALTSSHVSEPDGTLASTLKATWVAPADTDLAGYVLAVKEGTGNFVEFVLGPTATEWQTRSKSNVAYEAKIKAFDTRQNFSAFSTTVTHTTSKDTVAPAAPTGLTAQASFKNIFLYWVNPADSDLDKITIWENSTNTASTAQRLDTVNGLPNSSGTYTRSGLGTDQTKYYWVSAWDTSGNESAKSAVASATTAKAVSADLADAVIDSQSKFASTLKPVKILTSLSATGHSNNDLGLYGGELYRMVSGAWVKTVQAGDIAGQITNTQIGENSISTGKIQANAITGNKLALIPSGLTINADPGISDTTLWTNNASLNSVVTDNNYFGGKAWQSNGTISTGSVVFTEMFPIDINKVYRASIEAQALAAPNNAAQMYLGVAFYDANKADITGASNPGTGWDSVGSYHYFGVFGQVPPTSKTKYTKTFGPGQTSTAPANARFARLLAFMAYAGTGINRAGSFMMQEVIPAELIVDGSINTNKLSANAVEAGNIAAGVINASHIQSNTITTDKLVITGGNLIANGDFASGLTNWKKWNNPNATSVVGVNDGVSSNALAFVYNGSATASVFAANKAYNDVGASEDGFAVQPGRQYRVSFTAWRGTTFAGTLRFRAYYWKADGTYTSYTDVTAVAGTTLSGAAVTFTGDIIPPAGALRCWLYILVESWTAGAVYVSNVRCNLKSGGDLIVDGSIVTDHMAANSINGNRITAGTLHADKIQAGTITGDKISTGTSLPGSITVGTTGVSIEAVRQTVAATQSVTNIIPMKDWYPRSVSTLPGQWTLNNPACSQSLTTSASLGPSGSTEVMWHGYGYATNAGGAGFIYNFYDTDGYDHSKTYVFSYWFKRTGAGIGGGMYLGANTGGNTQNFADNTTNSNPYFISYNMGNIVAEKWYFMVGVLHGSGTNITTQSGLSGIYDGDTGVRIGAGYDYKSAPGSTMQTMRAFQFYAENTQLIFLARPKVEELSGSNTEFIGKYFAQSVGNWANDPANRINNGPSTLVEPGKIQISGSTTLSNWRNGSDTTKIEGGSIAANTINANKLTIGNRGVSFRDIEFQASANGATLSWANGLMFYTNDAGASTYCNIPASSITPGNSSYYYLYINKPGNGTQNETAPIAATTSWSTANTENTICLATWQAGTVNVIVNWGGTIIDGSKIVTGTIDANRIKANTVLANTVKIGSANGPTLNSLTQTLTEIGSYTTIQGNTTAKYSGTHGAYQGGAVGTALSGSAFIKSSLLLGAVGGGWATTLALDDDNSSFALGSQRYSCVYGAFAAGSGSISLYKDGNVISSPSVSGITANSRMTLGYDGQRVFVEIDGKEYASTTDGVVPGMKFYPKVLDYYNNGDNGTPVMDILYGPLGTNTGSSVQLWAPTGNFIFNGNSAIKLNATTAWDHAVFSRNSITGSAYTSFRITGGHTMAGFTDAVIGNASYSNLDYCWYKNLGANNWMIYESGAGVWSSSTGAFTDDTLFSISYDGANVRYYADGVLYRTVATTADRKFYFSSSLYEGRDAHTDYSQVIDVVFTPFTDNTWGNVAGTGKPADNATVGAPVGTNVGSVPAANVAGWAHASNTTFIDGGDIYTGTVTASKINVSSLSAISADIGTVTAGIVRSSDSNTSLDLGAGTITFKNGTHMSVSGKGFGSSNQFVQWYGPIQASLSSCTESNALFYLKTDGGMYYGGPTANSTTAIGIASVTALSSTSFIPMGDPVTVYPNKTTMTLKFNNAGASGYGYGGNNCTVQYKWQYSADKSTWTDVGTTGGGTASAGFYGGFADLTTTKSGLTTNVPQHFRMVIRISGGTPPTVTPDVSGNMNVY